MKTHKQTTCATRKYYNSSSFILWFTPFISSEIKNMVIIIITINIIKWPIPVFKCQIKQSAIGGLQIYTLTLFRNGSLICYDLETTLWMCCKHVNFPFVDNNMTKLRWKHAGKSSFSWYIINAYNYVGQVCFPEYQRTEDGHNIRGEGTIFSLVPDDNITILMPSLIWELWTFVNIPFTKVAQIIGSHFSRMVL